LANGVLYCSTEVAVGGSSSSNASSGMGRHASNAI
jgi:hypothetical protein